MNPESPGAENGARRMYPMKTRIEYQSKAACSFCCFVLTLYPTLKGMTPRDTTTFREHLVNAHGLRKEISP